MAKREGTRSPGQSPTGEQELDTVPPLARPRERVAQEHARESEGASKVPNAKPIEGPSPKRYPVTVR